VDALPLNENGKLVKARVRDMVRGAGEA